MSDPFGRDWVTEAQKLLLSLRDIVGADIILNDDEDAVAEINILAEGHRPPKQIVRDVRSALRAEYQVDVDYRKISVAQRRDPERDAQSEGGATILSLPAAQVDEEPTAARLSFEGVTVDVDQALCRVRVELSLGDREAVGEASGPNAPQQLLRLAAEAALAAIGKFLAPQASLVLAEVREVTLAGQPLVLVGVSFFKDRTGKVLTGTALVDHSLQQAVVCATLSALNRILGRLRFREPVEYRIRPTSMF